MPFVELNLKEINNEMLELAATEGLLFVEQAKAVVVEGEIKEVKKEADEKSRAESLKPQGVNRLSEFGLALGHLAPDEGIKVTHPALNPLSHLSFQISPNSPLELLERFSFTSSTRYASPLDPPICADAYLCRSKWAFSIAFLEEPSNSRLGN